MFWSLLISEAETDDCSSNSTKESEKNNTKIFHPNMGMKKSAPRLHFNCLFVYLEGSGVALYKSR